MIWYRINFRSGKGEIYSWGSSGGDGESGGRMGDRKVEKGQEASSAFRGGCSLPQYFEVLM